MKVKICGIMTEYDLSMCAAAGADALGFVVEYPVEVPWNLSAKDAAKLMKKVPSNVQTVLVTGGEPDKIIALAKKLQPSAVQLHYKESFFDVLMIVVALRPLGIRVIKALSIDEKGQLTFEISGLAKAAEFLQNSVDALLLDSCTAASHGGTGKRVDSRIYTRLQKHTSLPIILAGGLTPDNLQEVLAGIKAPCMVDVLSGVEYAPGWKDKEKVSAFIKAAKQGQEENT